MNEATKLAIKNGVSRKLNHWGYDRDLKCFQVSVEVSGYQGESLMPRVESDLFFVPGPTPALALEQARDLATFRFLGLEDNSAGKSQPAPTTTVTVESPKTTSIESSEAKVIPEVIATPPKALPQTVITTDQPEEQKADSTSEPLKRKPGRPKKSTEPTTIPLEKPEDSSPKLESTSKPKRVDPNAYNPDLKEHKVILATFLNKEEAVGDWAKNPKTGSWSKVTMKGKPFLDEKGEILQSFKDEALAFYAV